jgi:hypothetical protein
MIEMVTRASGSVEGAGSLHPPYLHEGDARDERGKIKRQVWDLGFGIWRAPGASLFCLNEQDHYE